MRMPCFVNRSPLLLAPLLSLHLFDDLGPGVPECDRSVEHWHLIGRVGVFAEVPEAFRNRGVGDELSD